MTEPSLLTPTQTFPLRLREKAVTPEVPPSRTTPKLLPTLRELALPSSAPPIPQSHPGACLLPHPACLASSCLRTFALALAVPSPWDALTPAHLGWSMSLRSQRRQHTSLEKLSLNCLLTRAFSVKGPVPTSRNAVQPLVPTHTTIPSSGQPSRAPDRLTCSPNGTGCPQRSDPRRH